jgi:hypothetical protein
MTTPDEIARDLRRWLSTTEGTAAFQRTLEWLDETATRLQSERALDAETRSMTL